MKQVQVSKQKYKEMLDLVAGDYDAMSIEVEDGRFLICLGEQPLIIVELVSEEPS